MASKSANHARSSSLPCEAHPLIASVEEKLSNFRTTDSVYQKLGGLKNLHEIVDDLLHMPLTGQAASHQNQENIVNDMLDGSVLLLDVCSTSRDVFSQMKETVQELESSLRRKQNVGSNIETEVRTYMISKKRLNKVIAKSLEIVRISEKNSKGFKGSGFKAYVRTMKEVEKTSLLVLESLLSYVSKRHSVSNMFKSRKDANEVEKMEAELKLLMSKQIKTQEIEILLKGLKDIESNFQRIEEELDCLYRQLLKNRVSLLNMINL